MQLVELNYTSHQELAELLVSLDEATALAERLKKRSEEMLGSLGSELATIKERAMIT